MVVVDTRPGATAFNALLDLVDSRSATAAAIADKEAEIKVLRDAIQALQDQQEEVPTQAMQLFSRIDTRKREIADLLGVTL